jgi:hypothetical protein
MRVARRNRHNSPQAAGPPCSRARLLVCQSLSRRSGRDEVRCRVSAASLCQSSARFFWKRCGDLAAICRNEVIRLLPPQLASFRHMKRHLPEGHLVSLLCRVGSGLDAF